MRRQLFLIALAGALFSAPAGQCATVSVTVTDGGGRPAENTVVELVPQAEAGPLAQTKVPAEAVVDQRQETFLPLVSLVRRNGRVVFTNNDTTMHQVYSFSDIKQFAFEIDEGQHSAPVVFDKPGVAAIGCNIHDHMITYVYVAASPWAVRTDANGRASIADVPSGTYLAMFWHPQLAHSKAPAPMELVVSDETARLTTSLALSAPDPRDKKHAHMQMY
jgi:plastocyanin